MKNMLNMKLYAGCILIVFFIFYIFSIISNLSCNGLAYFLACSAYFFACSAFFLHISCIFCIFPALFCIFSCVWFAYFLAYSAYSLSYFAFLLQNMQTVVRLSGVSSSFNQVQWVLKQLEEQRRAVPKLGPAQLEISMSLSSCAALGGRQEAGVL